MVTTDLRFGDCLDILPTLVGPFDAIITDLPYGTTACAWDSIIPLQPMWLQVKRLLESHGAFITTASQPFTSMLVMSNLEWFRQELIWDKVLPVGFLDSNRRHMRRHENIVVFSGSGYSRYNPQMQVRGVPRAKGGGAGSETDVYHAYGPRHSFNNRYYPTTIVTVSNGDRTRQEVGNHPTQKPVALYEYLVRTYTNPGDTVLDFCMGSGTTGVACVRSGRNFVGIEKARDYFEIAELRIKEARLQPMLPESQPEQAGLLQQVLV